MVTEISGTIPTVTAETIADPATGLGETEAAERLRRGEANTPVSGTSRTYATILRTNVFSFFNMVLFVIGVALLALGRYSDAFISVGLGLVNALIGAVQEMRAKHQLDALQLLDQTSVTVIRDGAAQQIAPDRIVRGDVLAIEAGQQIVVDGPLLDGGPIEADESLLTGESDAVLKQLGDDLHSGSLCLSGQGRQLARDVGSHSHAGRLTLDARRSTTDQTPLQRRIDFVVRLVIALTVLMSGAILAQALLEGFTLLRTVQITAVLSGLVPYGLFTLIAVAYTVGAVRISSRGALVQQVNAVESVSNVDVVCTDKTGTLTTGRLTLDGIVALGGRSQDTARAALGAYAHSVTVGNLTSAAIADALPGPTWPVRDEVPFSSALRWSGLTTASESWVLGAPDAMSDRLGNPGLDDLVAERAARGLRVLILAYAEGALRGPDGDALLPTRLEPVALIALADELRDDVVATIAHFQDEGVALKVISGDDPRTVAALATRAGLPPTPPVRGADLDGIGEAELDELVERTSVFGRVAPEQKERVVQSLRRRGHYVAMIGDGVNDARALKAAQVGVAMRSGSTVTRDVADIVLTEDSFGALLPAQQEGRKIVNGIASSMYVFLTRVTTQGIIIIAVTMLGLGFPYSPTQVGLTLFTVGVPTLFLTWWARPDRPDPHLLSSIGRFVMPASIITAGFATAIYTLLYTRIAAIFASGRIPARVLRDFEVYTGLSSSNADFNTAAATIGAQTGLTTFVSFASVLLIVFIAPPHRLLGVWTSPNGDRRPLLLVAALTGMLIAVFTVPALYSYFGLTQAAQPVFEIVLPGLGLWFAALHAAYRFEVFDRLLGLDRIPPD